MNHRHQLVKLLVTCCVLLNLRINCGTHGIVQKHVPISLGIYKRELPNISICFVIHKLCLDIESIVLKFPIGYAILVKELLKKTLLSDQ